MEINKHSNVFKKLLIWLMVLSLVVPMQMPSVNAATKLSAPTVSVKNVSSGVTVSWKKVSGATGYYVYRKTGDSYKKIKTVKDTSYTDKSVSSGKKYYYKVKAYKGKITATSSAKKILYLTTPSIKVSNTKSGIKVSWDKVKGAKKYRIYQKDSGSWKKLTDVTDTSYIDKSMKSGKSRIYTVKALNGDYASSCVSGKKMLYLSAPSVKVSNTTSGVKLSWDKVTGAKKYRIYQKDSGSWKKFADVTGTSYTDKSMKSGQKRTYIVKALNGDYASSYNSGKTQMFLSAPVVSFSESDDSTVLWLSWKAVKGASKYRIYYKKNGSWAKLTDTTKRTYGDSAVETGVEKVYAVKALKDSYSSNYKSYAYTLKEVHKHDWETISLAEPTCSEWGKEKVVCRTCEKKETRNLAPLGCDGQVTRVEPTCQKDGYVVWTCKRCGKTEREGLLAHGVPHDWKTVSLVEPTTCIDEAGAETFICQRCGEEKIEPRRASCDMQEASRVDATCMEDGYVSYICKNCGEEKTEVLRSPGEHNWKEISRTDATCLEEGFVTYQCSACGETKTNLFPIKNHTWEEISKTDATCEEDGSVTYQCSVCGEIQTGMLLNLGGHTWEETFRTDATCGKDGSVSYKCSVCGQTKTEVLDATEEHTWEETSRTDATCGKDGSVDYKCFICEQTKTKVLGATGKHTWRETSRTDATCEKDGSVYYKCYGCDKTKIEVIRSESVHVWEEDTENVWIIDQKAYDEEVVVGKKYCVICTGCEQKWYFDEDSQESLDAAVEAWDEHNASNSCPAGGGSYITDYDPIWETVHHEEEGHYEDIVTSRHCTICGKKENF